MIYQNLGTDFCALKSSYRYQKRPVFSPGLDHPFSERNKTTKTAVEAAVGGNREQGKGWTKFEKGCGWGGAGVFIK